MMSVFNLIFVLVFICLKGYVCQIYLQPEQVHLSLGANPTEMVVTWLTQSPTQTSTVEYGVKAFNLSHVATGAVSKFVDGGKSHRVLWVHRVTLTKLVPGNKYFYHCGSREGWSSLFYFTAVKAGQNWSPRFAVYGDLGNQNPQSLGRLQKECQAGLYDAILHVGDFAYNMDEDDARVGDEFMRQIEAAAAYVPYMTCVGNHENAYNFSNYVNRFNMPGGDGNNFFYSFDIGQAHIVSFSTEFYFYIQYGLEQIVRQFKWLEQDLKNANQPWNRKVRPWLITMGHRPMYCSDLNHQDCHKFESVVREGLEDLFYENGVDLEFWAHEHSYERLWPLYNRTVCNGSNAEPYTNPKAPVHVITGSAGCRERHAHFEKDKPYWSAFRNNDYGYTRLNVLNATHLYLEQVSDDQDGAIVDRFHVIKEKHGVGLFTCHQSQVPHTTPGRQRENLYKTLRKYKILPSIENSL